jgi:DnaJ family protein C protein 28
MASQSTETKKPRDWETWIDQQIREAQERGEFDNLPGSGQPLDLAANPYAQEREMAFKILKDSGYAPDWIELDKAIRVRLERARKALGLRWDWHRARADELAGRSGRWAKAERLRVHDDWRKATAEFEQEVAAINKEIAKLNLKVPSLHFQRASVDAANDIERLTGISR